MNILPLVSLVLSESSVTFPAAIVAVDHAASLTFDLSFPAAWPTGTRLAIHKDGDYVSENENADNK